MTIPRPLLLAALLLTPLAPQAQAQQKKENPICPWLTEGTATATLGTPITTAITLRGDPDLPEGTCTFTAPQGSILEIAVTSTPPEPVCPANSPKLTGIGNEATFCRLDRPPTETRYVLTSRVRDLFFRTTLTLQPPAPSPDPKQQEAHQQQLERIAEQVAGNLF
jgi:hypothetical protein